MESIGDRLIWYYVPFTNIELPFGGVGLSGHGSEKGFEALYGFSSLKTVATKYG